MKKVLLGTVLGIAFAGAASAAPVTGSFSANGFGAYLDNSNTAVTATNATRLDFGTYSVSNPPAGNGYGTPGTVFISGSTGSFATYNGTTATIQDIQLGGLGTTTATPFASPFLSFGGGALTLDFTSATATHNATTGTAINIAGTGTFTSGGTATAGNFNLATASAAGMAGSTTFSFTANGSAQPTQTPEPISLSLLGAGLIGLGATRLRRRKA